MPKKKVEEENTEELEKKAYQKSIEQEEHELDFIEYYKFPTILGWYFDGCFVNSFTLNEEYAEYFLEIEEELEAINDFELQETFTEQAARNFWPPKFTGPIFRTRGVYLDFKELKADPPKTPPEMNFERNKAAIGNFDDDDGEAAANAALADKLKSWDNDDDKNKKNLKNNWYWDEELDDFLPKEPEGEYFFDTADKVFKKQLSSARSPYDWYFHDKDGKFYKRDKKVKDNYFFNHDFTCWKKKGVRGPSKNGLDPTDYYYDENDHKWVLKSKVTDENIIDFHIQGRRMVHKGPRGASTLTSDDFFYDGVAGKMRLKDPVRDIDYKYDPIDEMWKKVGDDYGPGEANLFPCDHVFNNEEGIWKPKKPSEQKKLSPYDYYFDDQKGRYFIRDKSKHDLYEFDHKRNRWKLKGVNGPSENKLTHQDYYFNENSREWVLAVKADPNDLEAHNAGKRRVIVGRRGKSGKTDDDFFYDSAEGRFMQKNETKLSDYYYDPDNEIFRKVGQPPVPEAGKNPHSDYYFDHSEGKFLLTETAQKVGHPEAVKRNRPDLTAYDWCFNDASGKFEIRNVETPENYKYRSDTAVFHKLGPKGPSMNGKNPEDYYFDEVVGKWELLNSKDGALAVNYKNGRRGNRLGPRGTTGLIPDDLYFDTSQGIFVKKDKSNTDQYEYDTEFGVWKLKDAPPGPGRNGLNSPDYYWDDELGEFRLKRKMTHGELFKDRNTNLWRIKRRRPKDYFWDVYPGKWVRKPAKLNFAPEANKGTLKKAVKKADELIEEEDDMWKTDLHYNYNKPWLHSFPHLAADQYRLDQEKQRRQEEAHKKDEKKSVQSDHPTFERTQTKVSSNAKGAKTKAKTVTPELLQQSSMTMTSQAPSQPSMSTVKMAEKPNNSKPRR